jgi:hypothetical protein
MLLLKIESKCVLYNGHKSFGPSEHETSGRNQEPGTALQLWSELGHFALSLDGTTSPPYLNFLSYLRTTAGIVHSIR